MKVLMFGWEFPPFNSGGLGTACYGLTKGLHKHDVQVTFVLPKADPSLKAEFVKIVPSEFVHLGKVIKIKSLVTGYMDSKEYENEYSKKYKMYKGSKKDFIYGKDLFEEVNRYAKSAGDIARFEEHDIIHAHDWMTYLAGIEARKASKKPLVVHVHATEFDRTGDHPNQYIYDIERKGLHEADKIIAVSQFTKNKVIQHYRIHPDKIEVVHNAVEHSKHEFNDDQFKIKDKDKVVLFLGRVTIQKGPDYFVYAAKKALEVDPNIKFIIAGDGDMAPFIIEKAAQMGIADKVLFTGFLRGPDIDKAYQMADLYVMPSVSEPFGITPLEAMKNKTPVLISRQSGVSEVISHCLKVDFWDVNELANKIVSVLRYDELKDSLAENGSTEVKKFNWDIPAERCLDIYKRTIGGIYG
jgi:glycosyltransferase involved in cell wall biosynthesis